MVFAGKYLIYDVYVSGTSDYFGLNHYSSRYVKAVSEITFGRPHFSKDMEATLYIDESWQQAASTWLHVRILS